MTMHFRLVAAAVLLSCTGQALAAMTSFKDVPSNAWFASYVSQAAELGIVSGYGDSNGNPTGYFGPGDSVSVTQALKMEIGAAGIDPDSYRIVPCPTIQSPPGMALPYSDAWWYKYFLIAQGQGVSLTGCGFFGNGTEWEERSPDRPIRRWQMALLIADAYKVTPFTSPDENPYANNTISNVRFGAGLANPYTDVDATVQLHPESPIPSPFRMSDNDAFDYAESPDSRAAILRLTADGILLGSTSANGKRLFRPLDTLNRAEALKILLKARETYGPGKAATPASTDLEDVPPLPCTA